MRPLDPKPYGEQPYLGNPTPTHGRQWRANGVLACSVGAESGVSVRKIASGYDAIRHLPRYSASPRRAYASTTVLHYGVVIE